MRVFIAAAAVCGVATSAAFAAPTLDGFRDGAYGAPLAVQSVQTQFGDGMPDGGSELDARIQAQSPRPL